MTMTMQIFIAINEQSVQKLSESNYVQHVQTCTFTDILPHALTAQEHIKIIMHACSICLSMALILPYTVHEYVRKS